MKKATEKATEKATGRAGENAGARAKGIILKYTMILAELDPEAFMTINRVKEVKGRGYSFDVGRAKALRQERQPA